MQGCINYMETASVIQVKKKSRGMSFDPESEQLLTLIAKQDTEGNESLANRKAIKFYAQHLGIKYPTPRPASRKKKVEAV